MAINKFGECKIQFDKEYGNKNSIIALVPVNLEQNKSCIIKSKSNERNEEYYKWQFVYSIINSGMYSSDYIGVEVCLPKGNKNSAPIKFDAAIFKSNDWFRHYKAFHQNGDQEELDWLRSNMIIVIEFKNEFAKNVEIVFNQQLKPAIKEIESNYALGILYDTEKLYIFRRKNEKILRFNETFNKKGDNSTTKEISLDIPDSYSSIPTYDQIIRRISYTPLDRSNRNVDDLELISGASTNQLKDSVAEILKVMSAQSMDNERGYEILIQILALKIFDEKRSAENLEEEKLKFYAEEIESRNIDALSFFIKDTEQAFIKLSDENIQLFIQRMKKLYKDASARYKYILKEDENETISWNKESHIQIIGEIVKQFQDYSFIRSEQTDLYQLVFYQFANAFSKAEKGQFVTPLPIIDFLVNIVNPKRNETLIDPTVGIADFLAKTYKNSGANINDENLYGMDNDDQMITLAQLNMLLNGDGNSHLQFRPDKGSIIYKFNSRDEIVELDTKLHKNGNWDNWADTTKLKKFDIVLTNPPFGDGRKFEPKNSREKEIIEMYELWNIARDSNSIDLGLVFLENAYHILEENGRMGIILSNSLASVEKWDAAREWIVNKMRVVALFDLPSNVFADTGVNTTILIAYKPSSEKLKQLITSDYEVFIKDIKKVGYEVKTSKRVKYFERQYKLDDKYSMVVDENGNPVLNEEFSDTVKEFKKWCNTQESELKNIFL